MCKCYLLGFVYHGITLEYPVWPSRCLYSDVYFVFAVDPLASIESTLGKKLEFGILGAHFPLMLTLLQPQSVISADVVVLKKGVKLCDLQPAAIIKWLSSLGLLSQSLPSYEISIAVDKLYLMWCQSWVLIIKMESWVRDYINWKTHKVRLLGVNTFWTQYFTSVWQFYAFHHSCRSAGSLRIRHGLCIVTIKHMMCPCYVEISSPSCACAPASPSSTDPPNSRSIMLSGCWDNAVRKFDVSHPWCIRGPIRAKASKYGTLRGIPMDYGYNHVQNLAFSDLLWLQTKSVWILKSLQRRFCVYAVMFVDACGWKLCLSSLICVCLQCWWL